ncbi:MAG: AAA family ATPase [Myxococcales bacterium]|jgi:predicted ATP-binding protein involved in virulence|nr:AAA family ATPase [Myxococcales bacterium]
MSPSQLRIDKLHLENFRCFEMLDVSFEKDLTVFFAENGGGKTAILTALAMALDLLQPAHTKALLLEVARDVRHVPNQSGMVEPTGVCKVVCSAEIGAKHDVEWGVTGSAKSRRGELCLAEISDAIEAVRQQGERWPLLGFYGTGRFANERKPGRKPRQVARMDGYAGCLDASATDGPLLDWIKEEVLGDLLRSQRGQPQRYFAQGVFDALESAMSVRKPGSPILTDIRFDPDSQSPVACFEDGSKATWAELSDGFHVFMGLIGDIAMRAVKLNGHLDGAKAPSLIEGVVLIDEIDQHLHPRWQRTVLAGLKAAFPNPKLQFIVTTHSPQVLSSVENRQVRLLKDNQVRTQGVFVEGRDTNSILRELMGTNDRDERGENALDELYALIDSGKIEKARVELERMREKWGHHDPELIRAEGFLDEAAIDGEE